MCKPHKANGAKHKRPHSDERDLQIDIEEELDEYATHPYYPFLGPDI